MLQLVIKDAKGVEVVEGDWVLMTGSGFQGSGLSFYGKVECVNGALMPFDAVCYRHFVKVDSLPKDAVSVKDEPAIFRNPHKASTCTEEEIDGWYMNLVSSIAYDKAHFTIKAI
jgi:hypothetical protein